MRINYAQAVHGEAEEHAVVSTLRTGWLGEAKQVAAFEAAIARLAGKKHGISANSGSSANFLALAWIARARGRGGEVITPACTFNTVVAPIIQHGFTPIFVDARPGRYVAEAAAVAKAITERTVAMVIPHLLGNVAEVNHLRAMCDVHELLLLEDCCDALGSMYHGKSVGNWGDVATFSFYPSHQITAMGGGGMVVTDDDDAAEYMRRIRDWGRGDVYATDASQSVVEDVTRRFSATLGEWPYDRKFLYEEWGFNFKMTEAAAAFGLVQFDRLGEFRERRSENFWRIYDGLSPLVDRLILPEYAEHALPCWLAFPITLKDGKTCDRTKAVLHLEAHGIQTRMIMAGNITRHPAMAKVENWGHRGELTGSDHIARGGFMVGCHHGMGEAECDEVVARITEVLK